MSQPRGASVEAPVVVDTDVLSFLQKGDSRREKYLPLLSGRTLVISFQTVAEQLRWAVEKNWGDRRRMDLEAYLRQFLVYPYSMDLAREWAHVMTETRRAGRPLSTGDGWVAATSRLARLPLVTHNRKDFAAVAGLELISFGPD